MKNIYTILLASAIMILASCQRDDSYYFDERDVYLGNYAVTDYCDNGVSDYSLSVIKADASDEIMFTFPGLFEAGMDVHAIVTGMKIIIPIQDFYVSSFPEIVYEFSGSGSLNDSLLRIDYQVLTIQDGLIIDDIDCSADLVLQ